MDQTGPDEPFKGELKVTEKKEMGEDDPAYAEATIPIGSNDSSVVKVLDCRHSQVPGATTKVRGRTLFSQVC